MKIIIEKKELSSLTALVHRAASTKNTIPVLSGLLIEVSKDKGLIMTATDMEIGIKASTKNVEIFNEGTVLVNAHYFADFIKLLPDSPILIELNEDKAKLNITYGRSSGYINTYSDYEYPDLPLEKQEHKISIPEKILREALRKTSFAAALTHFRQVFTGVLFDIKDDNTLKIIASDTHRLSLYSYKLSEETDPCSFIIPTRSVSELMRIIDDKDDLIDIYFSENNIIFSNDNFILLSRIIDGQYPNYEQVIPNSFSSVFLINARVLANTLERAKIMPTDDKTKIQHVQFSFNNKNEAVVECFSEIMGEIQEVIENLSIEGDKDFKIAFNTNYFLDIVKILDGECDEIRIELSGALGPAKIMNPKIDNYLYVLVPLRTSN